MKDMIFSLGHSSFSFVLVITAVVFAHEFGHFFFARLFGVGVEQFSIGFGKPIWRRIDKHGTEWKIGWLPMGGYIKMYGDANPASAPDYEALGGMTHEEKAFAFHCKPLWQKAMIIAAGPGANYISAIGILSLIFIFNGVMVVSPTVGDVVKDGPAAVAGMKPGDVVAAVDGKDIDSFMELKSSMATSLGEVVHLTVKRGDHMLDIDVKPEVKEVNDGWGKKGSAFFIGIIAKDMSVKHVSISEAISSAILQTYDMSAMMLRGLWQIISGARSGSELGGPIKIAQYSGDSMKHGVLGLLTFIVMISVNLGMVNLLPIPLLDGGHLLFYAIESIIGGSINRKVLSYSYRIGFMILATMMIYAVSNDIKEVIHYFAH